MFSKKVDKFIKKYKKYRKIQSIENRKKFNRFRSWTKHAILMHWTWPKKVFLGMFIIILIGAIFLYLPISYDLDYSQANGKGYEYVNNEYIFYLKQSETDLNNITKMSFNFVDSLYLAVSSFTTTGISGKIDVGSHMSIFGQIVMFVLLQVGGFGYASLIYLFGRLLQKMFKREFFSSTLSNIERGGTKIAESSKILLWIFVFVIIVQIIFAFVFSIIFVLTPFKNQVQAFTLLDGEYVTIQGLTVDGQTIHRGYGNYGLSLWQGLFLTGAAINNAGFDLFGTSSLSLFRNDIGILVQLMVISLFVIGGIGYQVIYDIILRIEYIFKYHFLYRLCKVNKYANVTKTKVSSFTKICLMSTIVIILISTASVYLTEYAGSYTNYTNIDNFGVSMPIRDIPQTVYFKDETGNFIVSKPFGNNHSSNLNFALFFNSMSTRSAGFATFNMSLLTENTKWLFIVLMFLGTSPSSTGGGIRITTIAIVYKASINWLRGLDKSSLYKRNIPVKDVLGALLLTLFSFSLIILASFVTYLTTLVNHIEYEGQYINLLDYLKNSQHITLTFSDFVFESASAFGTCGLSTGILSAQYLGWWSKLIPIMLMIIGQLGIGATLLLFARKVPKRNNPNYIEQSIRIG